MSAGENPPVVQPVPVVVTPQSQLDRWKFLVTPIVLVLLALAVNRGWLTAQQADAIKPFVMAKNPNGEEQTVTVMTKPTAPQVGLSPDEIQRWVDILSQIIDKLPKPVPPKPVPPVPVLPPNPVPPVPVPPPNPFPPIPDPIPQPGALAILVADELGRPITTSTVEAGQLFRVSAVGSSGDVAWQNSRHGNAKLSASTDGREFTGYLSGGESVDFGLTDFGQRKQLSIRISCGEGPRPPPLPLPPGPNPDPKPVQPVQPAAGMRVLILYESQPVNPITASQATALNSTRLMSALNAACVKDSDGRPGWRKWDKDLGATVDVAPWPDIMSAAKARAVEAGLPAMAIIRGTSIKIYPLTTDTAALALIGGA